MKQVQCASLVEDDVIKISAAGFTRLFLPKDRCDEVKAVVSRLNLPLDIVGVESVTGDSLIATALVGS